MANEHASRGTGRATMKDVARLAGVGVKTVSRVVNGEAYVSDETREAVERAIKQLRFRRNASAAGLRHGQSRSVGLIVVDLGEPFQAALVRAVEQALYERGVLLFTASSGSDEERERAMAHEFVSRRVDGLILLPVPRDHSYLQAEVEAGLPLVFVDRQTEGISPDFVASDNRLGARLGIDHLLGAGHRRIAFIGEPREVFAGGERLAGYQDALARAGVAYDPALVFEGAPTIAHSEQALITMTAFPDPPTALFTGDSLHTIATLRAPSFSSTGLAHIAFDDLEAQDLFARPLDVVSQHPDTIGARAVELLLDRIQGESGPRREIRVEPHLLIRSGEPGTTRLPGVSP